MNIGETLGQQKNTIAEQAADAPWKRPGSDLQRRPLASGKMMVRLQELARDLGVIILGGIDVTGWESGPHGIHITTKGGRTFQTRRLGLATNGFTPAIASISFRPELSST
ncbi:MAG: hypothetical protein IPJ06_08930 [Saprospiraceae bacterium]|nr:hypothetical protein [Saprospiraceae bacterium]